jgi:murein DD-endopeptidase MepM/ murein hydrolase activator NlpD
MAVIPNNIFRTISDTKQQTASSKRTIFGISNILSKKITDRKNIGSSIRLFKNRRIQIGKRKALQDQVSAPTVVTKIGGPRALAQASNETSLKDRLFGFIGYLSAGWILGNLPTWIALGEQFTGRIIKATSILSEYGDETMKIISSLGEILQSAFINLANLDFTDSSFLVRSSFQDLITNIDGLGVGISEAFAVLTEPFKNIPKIGTISEEPDAYNQPGTALPDAQSAEMYRIAAALSTEGSGAQSTVDMMQVIVNRKASGRYGSTYTDILAAGESVERSHFQGVWKRPGGPKGFRKIETLEDAAKWSGQSKGTLLKIIENIQNPTLQANSAKFVGGAFEFRASPQNNKNGRLPGTAWRGGAGDNQFLVDVSRGDPIRKEGPAPFNLPAPVAKSTPQVSGKLTTSVVGDVDVVGNTNPTVGRSGGGGEYLARGGAHKGIDIGTSHQKGYYVAFRQNGKVTFAGWDGGGYGNLVIIQSGNLEFYFAHLAKIMVKNGSQYNGETIGEIGNTGGSRGEHLHYEVRKGGRHINPEPYLGLLAIGKSLRTTSGQIISAAPLASLKPEAPGSAKESPTSAEIGMQNYNDELLTLLTTERTGRKIVVIDDRQSTLPQILQSGSGSENYNSVNEFDLVNTFIKNKLLLDLNYL